MRIKGTRGESYKEKEQAEIMDYRQVEKGKA